MTSQERAEQNARCLSQGFTGMKNLREEMPSVMEYETEVNKKEGYNRIQEIFAEAGKAASGLSFEKNPEELADYMTALALCGQLIDEEVFDHYKNLEAAFKKVLHRMADPAVPGRLTVNIGSEPAERRIGKAICTACDAGMILEEKYRALGRKMAGEDDR